MGEMINFGDVLDIFGFPYSQASRVSRFPPRPLLNIGIASFRRAQTVLCGRCVGSVYHEVNDATGNHCHFCRGWPASDALSCSAQRPGSRLACAG